MLRTIYIIIFGVFISYNSHAADKCSCPKIENQIDDQAEVLNTLKSVELDYTSKLITDSVRGVISASYFYCEKDSGFLLVKLHDKELLYKDVPLQKWFEFKYSDTATAYYKDEIKYNYIAR